jgi:hypothetical protein
VLQPQPGLLCALQPNKEMWEGKCVDKCGPLQFHTQPDGECKVGLIQPQLLQQPLLQPGPIQPIVCEDPQEAWEGQCVDACGEGEVHTEPDGECKETVVVPPLQVQPGLIKPQLQLQPVQP